MSKIKVTEWSKYKYGKNLQDGLEFDCEVVPYLDLSGIRQEMALVSVETLRQVGADGVPLLGDAIFKIGIGCHIVKGL